ncbi:MAG: proton extrusion protein PcxA, partial [Cyanobacteria bacterium K_DeepCast_35m_m2_023]|nr:proton extrusion protein PcxA [Cyanobacteria bacterium K_DeepCast_35m_m2_023]
MALNDWIGAFGRAETVDLNNQLERGYESALLIQSIELEHYNDRPVRPEVDLRLPAPTQAMILRRFRSALQICRDSFDQFDSRRAELSGQEVRQLQLIQDVVLRYSSRKQLPTLSRSPEVLPRSLLGVVDQVRRQLDPEAEASVVAGFRRRRDSTLVALRVLLLLILVPVLVQQSTRLFVVTPLVDRYAPTSPFLTYPKPALEERAVEQLRVFQAEVEFDALLKGKPLPTRDELQAQLSSKAQELKDQADEESTEAIKNVIADLFALFGFAAVCFCCRRDLQVLRGFVDELIYGLSDSAKAFAIILFTDIFVGFHSPEGWTVLLDGVAHH